MRRKVTYITLESKNPDNTKSTYKCPVCNNTKFNKVDTSPYEPMDLFICTVCGNVTEFLKSVFSTNTIVRIENHEE
jgi:transcription elongation factor Elf1